MRILFDHQVFSWQAYGGISRYIVEQMRGLNQLGQTVLLPEHFFSENVYLRGLPDYQRDSLTSFGFKGKKMLQNLLGRTTSNRALRVGRPDVFHPTYFDPYFLPTLQKQGIPFVLTVHDMIHEIYGHGRQGLFSLDAHVVENKRLLAEKAEAVIAVSENTRKDLLRFCPGVDPAKIHVIHHGNAMQPGTQPVPPSDSFRAPYLLFVGQRKAYKNFSWMVEQLADLLRSEPDLQLVCVGGSDFDTQELDQFSRLGLVSKVQYLRVNSDLELAGLYQKAACFIFPSQYEGFGIPVLEAFACACPVVLNRASSLPEVGGDAAAYFDEANPEQLEEAVRGILFDSEVRKNYIKAGLERTRQFTWADSVGKHLAVYQGIVK